MAADRDHLVDLLTWRERGEEDVFFRRRDRELIARQHEQRRREEEDAIRARARMRCPECGTHLREVRRRGVKTEVCPAGHGLWVRPEGLYEIPKRERNSWFARYYPYMPH